MGIILNFFFFNKATLQKFSNTLYKYEEWLDTQSEIINLSFGLVTKRVNGSSNLKPPLSIHNNLLFYE